MGVIPEVERLLSIESSGAPTLTGLGTTRISSRSEEMEAEKHGGASKGEDPGLTVLLSTPASPREHEALKIPSPYDDCSIPISPTGLEESKDHQKHGEELEECSSTFCPEKVID